MNIFARMKPVCIAFAIAAAATACTTLPPETRAAVERFDPLSFDPRTPRLALVAPDMLDAMPNEARVIFNHWPASDPAAVTSETFVLQRVREALPPGINDGMREGEIGVVFRIAPKDFDRVRRLQALYREEKRGAVPKLRSRIDASVKACRLAHLPGDGLRGSVFIKLEANSPFVPLMRDVDIRSMLKEAGKAAETQIEVCPHTRAKVS